MLEQLVEKMKNDLQSILLAHLEKEGVLYFAANDNSKKPASPSVFLREIDDTPLEGKNLLSEIRIILEVWGKPFQSDALIQGLYEALQPHHLTFRELSVLLMTIHVEVMHPVRPRRLHKRATMRYFVEAV